MFHYNDVHLMQQKYDVDQINYGNNTNLPLIGLQFRNKNTEERFSIMDKELC